MCLRGVGHIVKVTAAEGFVKAEYQTGAAYGTCGRWRRPVDIVRGGYETVVENRNAVDVD